MRRLFVVVLMLAAAGCSGRPAPPMSPETKAKKLADLPAVREYLKGKHGDRFEEVRFWATQPMWLMHYDQKELYTKRMSDPSLKDAERGESVELLRDLKAKGPMLCCRMQYVVKESPPSEWIHDEVFQYVDGEGFVPISDRYDAFRDFADWSGPKFKKEESK